MNGIGSTWTALEKGGLVHRQASVRGVPTVPMQEVDDYLSRSTVGMNCVANRHVLHVSRSGASLDDHGACNAPSPRANYTK